MSPTPKPKPTPASGITAYLDAYSVAPARPGDSERFLSWVAEIAWLSEMHGAATPALWHEVVRGRGGAEGSAGDFSRTSSNRHFARLKNDLIAHGVPHERVKVESLDDDGRGMGASMVGIRITVARTQLERFALPLKRCVRSSCEWHEKGIPARPPWFYRNAAAADGLDSMCSACRRAAVAGAQKSRPRVVTPALRASWRKYNASAAGRSRKSKFNANRCANNDTHGNQLHGSLVDVYRRSVKEFMESPFRVSDEQQPVTLVSSLSQPQTRETNFMRAAAPKSIRDLIAHLNAIAVLGPGVRITHRMVDYLLTAAPELEPPKIAGNRMFDERHVEGVRAAFEARRAAKAAREGARAARAAKAARAIPR